MANNELFYRVAREALNDESEIQELVDDLDAAVESYLQAAADTEALGEQRVRDEIRHGRAHAEAFTDNLRAWELANNCRRCGSPLVGGRCSDETCPYSDRLQYETWTEG